MATRIEQTTNDLLHFSGKYNPTKFRAKSDKRKVLLRAYSREQFWSIRASDFSLNTHNPIRSIVDGLKIEPNKEKSMIALSLGDPTTFGNLQPADEVLTAMKKVIDDGIYNGYGPAVGFIEARQAVAEYSLHQGEDITANDVILCSGCSCALDLAIAVIANESQNILIPRPGFSIYKTLAEGFGVECRSYNLLPEKSWEVDLKHMESLIDVNTSAIIITNPSNPCGSVFSKQHILDILAIAEKHHVPIIADEIYEHFVFPGNEYHSVSSLSRHVPVLSCGGLTKRFLVPGWRMGWIIIHDRHNAFQQVRVGLNNLASRILGSNSLVQGALPMILKNTPQKFYDELVETLKSHADVAYEMLSAIKGLNPIMPSGAMYMMVGIEIEKFPEFNDELDFVQDLVKEQSVFCLPGKCFEIENYFRIVLTVPKEMMIEACDRIAEFCEHHYMKKFASTDDFENELEKKFQQIL